MSEDVAVGLVLREINETRIRVQHAIRQDVLVRYVATDFNAVHKSKCQHCDGDLTGRLGAADRLDGVNYSFARHRGRHVLYCVANESGIDIARGCVGCEGRGHKGNYGQSLHLNSLSYAQSMIDSIRAVLPVSSGLNKGGAQ